jgi:hypothetical protein
MYAGDEENVHTHIWVLTARPNVDVRIKQIHPFIDVRYIVVHYIIRSKICDTSVTAATVNGYLKISK